MKTWIKRLILRWNQATVNSGKNKALLDLKAQKCHRCGQGEPVINPWWAYTSHEWCQKAYWVGCSKCYWSTFTFNDLETAIRNYNWHLNYKAGDETWKD